MLCPHRGCTCTVEGEGAFCSEYCETHGQHGEDETHRCECGHPDCDGS
ncbi:MAG TPA: hypothetical protein VK646_02875 [Actinomycetota bacterium]|nr:hypothetical protein [Actinomycetota bacterium]